MKIAIIGGGAAGMMAAATIAEESENNEVFIFEKNSVLGRKVSISGGGRCNLTTGIADIKEVLENYPRGRDFIKFAMYSFSPIQLQEWFNSHNLELKVEKDMRVFPISDKSSDVIDVFYEIFSNHRINVVLNISVNNISKKDEKFIISFDKNDDQVFDKVILCVGGQAFRHTGSTGDGYSFAEILGHNITKLSASLNSFITSQQWPTLLSGLSFENLNLKLVAGDKTFKVNGPILFTHKGLTGPAIFKLSAYVAHFDYSNDKPIPLFVDFMPNINYENLLLEIRNRINSNPGKSFVNILRGLLPKSLITELIRLSNINGSTLVSEIPKAPLNKLVENIKNCQIDIIGRASGEEFVTAGGIDLSEVDSKTMESKLCPNLYFAGEILDIDAFTGGFNLQSAWCTGRLAARSVIS